MLRKKVNLFLATGDMSYVNPQDKYHFTGDFIMHHKYGKQFQITNLMKLY